MTHSTTISYPIKTGPYIKRVPISLTLDKDRYWFKFRYNKTLLGEVKSLEARKWHDESKVWSAPVTPHNQFQVQYLQHKADPNVPDPYARYEAPLLDLPLPPRFNRIKGKEVELFEHQKETIRFILTRKCCIVAEEMGLGKTLSAIIAAEHVPGLTESDFWWVAPKSVLKAIERELIIWNAKIRPTLMTYERMVAIIKEWPPGQMSPRFVVLDESFKVKTPTSQRSQAASELADGVRGDREDGYIVLMTGTPAPKAPDDWWMPAHIACPGFLKEGDIFKFRNRLGIYIQKQSMAGGVYPERVCWKDDEKRCAKCGEFEDHANHINPVFLENADAFHAFEPGMNEVHLLSKRLVGLVLTKFKKDCLDLPEKRYEIVECKPSPSILRAANAIARTCSTVIEVLTRHRELSDGFQYQQVKEGKVKCPRCGGSRKTYDLEIIPDSCEHCKGKNYDDPYNQCEAHEPETRQVLIDCPSCDQNGEVPKLIRITKRVECPKDDLLDDDLERHAEVGRLVVFGGFTETVERVVDRCHLRGWGTIKVTGKGWDATNANGTKMADTDYLSIFQDWKEKYPLVAFVADPGSGGVGLTLTASPTIIFYSNSHNGGDRSQAEDRGHRPGMDLNRGLTIKDYIHLPTDLKVRDNLLAKRRLELMSMGELTFTERAKE